MGRIPKNENGVPLPDSCQWCGQGCNVGYDGDDAMTGHARPSGSRLIILCDDCAPEHETCRGCRQ